MPPTSIFSWHADFDVAHTADALRELDRLMRGLRDAPAEPTELEAVRERALRDEPSFLATTAQTTELVAAIAQSDLSLDAPQRLDEQLRAITAAEVQRVAAATLDPTRLKVIVIGDWSALKPQLAGLGWGPVEVRDVSGAILRVEGAP
jgi:zinc protease